MPPKTTKQTEVTETTPFPERAKCNPALLGRRVTTKYESRERKVGETDLGKDLVIWEHVAVEHEIISPLLNLEEAQALEDSFGEQDWRSWGDQGEFCCKFRNGEVSRRFIIPGEVKEALCVPKP